MPRLVPPLATFAYRAALVLLALCAAEGSARVQDRLRWGTPLLSTPDWERDLFIDSQIGRRGRPFGRYKYWALNQFGFRHGPMDVEPAPGVQRIAVVGASEAFGLYESPGREFPEQLQRRLDRNKFEVVNVALTGLTLGTSIRYWEEYVAGFRPTVAVIYPSPLFYLRDAPPRASRTGERPALPRADARSRIWLDALSNPRMLDRARDLLDVPDVIQRWRDERAIRAAVSEHPGQPLLEDAPRERVTLLIDHLSQLVDAVSRVGTIPIVVTHASRIGTRPPSSTDWRMIQAARVNTPRATPQGIIAFEHSVNDAVRRWCRQRRVHLVDADQALSGHAELFADLIHFNDQGAAKMADLLVPAISE